MIGLGSKKDLSNVSVVENGKTFQLEADWHLSIQSLAAFPCTWCPSLKSQKGFIKSWITFDLDSFGKVMSTKENTVLQSRVLCANLKIREDYEYKI